MCPREREERRETLQKKKKKKGKKNTRTFTRKRLLVVMMMASDDDAMMDADKAVVAPTTTTAAATTPTKRKIEVKKWNAVAVWSWSTSFDSCAICRNTLHEPSIEFQANSQQEGADGLSIAVRFFAFVFSFVSLSLSPPLYIFIFCSFELVYRVAFLPGKRERERDSKSEIVGFFNEKKRKKVQPKLTLTLRVCIF